MPEEQEIIKEQESGTEENDPKIEAKASRMGWVPEEKFRGESANWIPAEEFVERGETQLPIMKERLKKMDGKVVELEGTISGMKETFRKFKEYHSQTEAKQYKKAERDLAGRQRIAVVNNDINEFDSIEQERIVLQKEMETKNAEAEAEDDNEAETAALAVFNSWKEDNAWYDEDFELKSYAQNLSTHIQDTKGLGGKRLYDEVTKEVKNKFPEKFGNAKRNTPNAVVGDGEHIVANGKQTFSNLPKDAQADCLRFMEEIPGFTKKEYVENYEW